MNQIFEATFWGFVSGGALVIGAAIGYFAKVPGKVAGGEERTWIGGAIIFTALHNFKLLCLTANLPSTNYLINSLPDTKVINWQVSELFC